MIEKVYAWLPLQGFFTETTTNSEWMCIWDHIISNPAAFMYCFLVAYITECKLALMLIKKKEAFNVISLFFYYLIYHYHIVYKMTNSSFFKVHSKSIYQEQSKKRILYTSHSKHPTTFSHQPQISSSYSLSYLQTHIRSFIGILT